jgi:hypothetical protein
MENILKKPVPMAPVSDALSAEFSHLFDRKILAVSEATLLQEANVQVG